MSKPRATPETPSVSCTRPIDPALHPIETGHYRIATPAIQAFNDLVQRCLRYRITGALAYGPSRIGKTRAIEYLRLLLAQTHPKITTYHVQAEHKPRHAEGPFFSSLLDAVGHPEPVGGSNPAKRLRLVNKIKEACSRNGSGIVILFCDEAQRFDENEYEWCRDVHDHLDRLNIRLFTFLVGQQELLAVKTALQHARKTQIVARLMVEELAFHGVRNVGEVSTCLAGYDQTNYPRASDWSFTRFYVQQAVHSGYRLSEDASVLWNAFEKLHNKHGLSGDLEIPMESFARAVEIVLKDSELRDAPGYRPAPELWEQAVRSCGYVQSRIAVSSDLLGRKAA
jgi:hypothetical protein